MARTANTQLITTDSGKWIDITAGTFTQTFLAPAALGVGWWCYLQNSGTGDITIPSSDGRTNWVMYPNEVRLFQCDGSVLRSVVLVGFRRTFTSSGSLIRPPGYKEILGIGWDGGQSGGMSSVGVQTNGGAPGSLKEYRIGAENTKTELAVVIGAGGLSIAITGTQAGNPGGVTALDGLAGALSSRADAVLYKAGRGGDSNFNGAAANPGEMSTYGGNGGSGSFGTASGSVAQGMPGAAPGGGGGASSNNGWQTPSGAGARGELRTWGVK